VEGSGGDSLGESDGEGRGGAINFGDDAPSGRDRAESAYDGGTRAPPTRLTPGFCFLGEEEEEEEDAELALTWRAIVVVVFIRRDQLFGQ
jgi:hypothetical protein